MEEVEDGIGNQTDKVAGKSNYSIYYVQINRLSSYFMRGLYSRTTL